MNIIPCLTAVVAGLVERVLAANPPSRGATTDKAVRELEQAIDERVYRLYGLTRDEVKLVEDSVKR